jgi:hypothetical protein
MSSLALIFSNPAIAAKTMGDILSEFIQLLVGGIKDLATGVGSGVNGFVKDLFLEVDSTGVISGLSTFGGIVAIFGGIALAVGITTLIFNWIRSIGN